MPQTIKAEVIMEVPSDQVIISKTEFNEYQSLKDDGRWWTSKDIFERYHHRMDWMKENILLVPTYQRELDAKNGGCVHYADPENGKFWSFEPKRFKKFMEDNFAEINS